MPTHHHETSDLYLANALLTAGHEPAGIDRRGKRSWFLFAPETAITEASRRFYTGQLPLDARGYSDNIKALKNALHAAGRGR